tara:strand:- start:89350 stop:89880 length:531 start_codon:yes stop_codon:yes gene_type:complete
MTTMKNVTKLICILAIAVAFVNCRGKEEKPSDATPTESTGPTAENSAVDSTAMSFDPSGSDSGKIDGLKTVFFDYDKSTLSGEAKKVIAGNVEWMKKNTNAKVQIEGHCDNRGSIEYNVALGERRANAVRDYMASLGISGNRLATISYGEEKPLVSSENESAWKKNRRANFVPSSM